jgi:hypothetical protein
VRSCESVRKAIERVFGILKKRFRILKIPLPCYNLSQIVDIVHSCCILHNMILEDKDRINIGHLVNDWIDKGPLLCIFLTAGLCVYCLPGGVVSLFQKRGGLARTSNFRKAVFDWLLPNKLLRALFIFCFHK